MHLIPFDLGYSCFNSHPAGQRQSKRTDDQRASKTSLNLAAQRGSDADHTQSSLKGILRRKTRTNYHWSLEKVRTCYQNKIIYRACQLLPKGSHRQKCTHYRPGI